MRLLLASCLQGPCAGHGEGAVHPQLRWPKREVALDSSSKALEPLGRRFCSFTSWQNRHCGWGRASPASLPLFFCWSPLPAAPPFWPAQRRSKAGQRLQIPCLSAPLLLLFPQPWVYRMLEKQKCSGAFTLLLPCFPLPTSEQKQDTGWGSAPEPLPSLTTTSAHPSSDIILMSLQGRVKLALLGPF